MNDLVRRNVQIDFGTLKGTLPWDMVPSDVDGLLEFNGHFLLIETKFGQVELSKGQYKTMKALSGLTEFCVLVVAIEEQPAGAPGVYRFEPTHWRCFNGDGQLTKWKPLTLKEFQSFLKRWFEYAKENN